MNQAERRAELRRLCQVGESVVTAILCGDRELAADLVHAEGDRIEPLALGLADLVAHIHVSWSLAAGQDADEAMETWRLLMLTIAQRREAAP